MRLRIITFLFLNVISIAAISQNIEKANYNQWLIEKESQGVVNWQQLRSSFDASWKNKVYQKGSGWKQFHRWLWLKESRANQQIGTYDPLAYSKAYKDFLQSYRSASASDSNGNWSPLGPTSWTNGNDGYNPGLGRINAITVAPNDSNTIYVATASGGIWKTIDGGASWNTTTDYLTILGTSDIAVDPNNSNIVYIATGDRDGLDTWGVGVMKSIDGGSTWQNTGLSYSNAAISHVVNKLLHHPDSSGILFAAANDGIWKTIDTANTWTKVSNFTAKDLEYQPNNHSVVFASNVGFYKSTDGGNTFNQVTTGLPISTGRMAIAITPGDSNYVYLVAADNLSQFDGVFKSTNAGDSFALQISGDSINLLGYSQDGTDNASQAWYDLAIAASPSDPEKVYVGGVNVWESADGGQNWTITSHWYYINDPSVYSHADIHSLDFYHNKLYCGSDGGIFKYDQSAGWSDLSSGLGIMQVYRMGGAQQNPNLIMSGAQDNGTNLYNNGNWTHMFGADGMEAKIDHFNSNILYGCWQLGNIIKSTDFGASFNHIFDPDDYNDNGAWVTPYEMSDLGANRLFVACKNVYRSLNGGISWTPISANLSNTSLKTLAMGHNDENYIYGSYGKALLYTYDGGANWNTKLISMPFTEITDIEVDALDPLKVYLTLGGSSNGYKVLYSEDGGASFSNITANLPNIHFNTLVLDSSIAGAIYAGADIGIYYTDSTMNQWVPFSDGIPNVIISELEINYGAEKLRAATYGRGIWESVMFPEPPPSPISGYKEWSNQFTITPNPTTGLVSIHTGRLDKNYTVRIYNASGILVEEPFLLEKSVQTVDLSQKVSGMYFMKISNGKKEFVQRIALIKK